MKFFHVNHFFLADGVQFGLFAAVPQGLIEI